MKNRQEESEQKKEKFILQLEENFFEPLHILYTKGFMQREVGK